MELLVIRHGTAEDAKPGVDDSQRSLTKEGRKEMKKAAAGLTRLVETIDIIAASPLVRAQQTAEIVAAAYDNLVIETLDSLSPGSDLGDLAKWLRDQASAEVVAIVGHEPHLGTHW
jgi:phosphohistidine phosphatase